MMKLTSNIPWSLNFYSHLLTSQQLSLPKPMSPNRPVICATPNTVNSNGMSNSVRAREKAWSEDLVFNTLTIWTPHFTVFLPEHPLSLRRGWIKTPPIWNKTPSWIPLNPAGGLLRRESEGGGGWHVMYDWSSCTFIYFWVCLMSR